MREICTSGSVGGEDGDILAYPAATRGRQPISGLPEIGQFEIAQVGNSRLAVLRDASQRERCDAPQHEAGLLRGYSARLLSFTAAAST